MNLLARWLKFNLVGIMGAGIQLTSLAALNRIASGHYLFATAIALELTLLHNFAWHVYYTWRGRRHHTTLLTRLMRFHLSNGIVSFVGNLALMKLLVGGARLPVIAADAIAILCCSLINFLLGETWVFGAMRVAPQSHPERPNPRNFYTVP